MILPLYQGIETPQRKLNAHKGLWFERFFNHYMKDSSENWVLDDGNKKTEKDKKGVNAKRIWINKVTGEVGQKSTLERASQQQLNLSLSLGGEARAYTAVWHLTTGLGNPHPVENGFCWHPTLGTPFIAGSAVKGLIRSWIECWSEWDEQKIKNTCLDWFGSENKDPTQTDKDNQAGGFIFFDALPTEPVTLHCDVMTPHMGNWYSDGGQITSRSESETLPADWHNPIPIPFLVVKNASFLFSIAPRIEDMKSELPEIMKALDSALSYLGVGAKTAAGYGLLDPVPEKLRKMEEQQIKKEEESHFIIATLAIKSGRLGIKLPSEKEPFYLPSDKSTEYMNLLYPEKLDQKGRKKRNDKINKGNTKVEVRVRTHANFTDILELRPLEENKG